MSETLAIAKSIEEALTRKGIHGCITVIDPPISYSFIHANTDALVREVLAAVLYRAYTLTHANNSIELAGEIQQCIQLMGLQRKQIKEN